MIQFTILSQCVSSKNRKIQSVVNGRAMSFNNPDLERFKRDFLLQVPPEAKKLLACRVAVIIQAYYASDRPDLEVEAVYDLLQKPRQIGRYWIDGAGVIENDRQIVVKHAEKFIDPENPRLVITVQPLAAWNRSGKQASLLAEQPEGAIA